MFSPSELHAVGGVPFAYVTLRATARTLDAVIKTLKLAECKVSRINHEKGGGGRREEEKVKVEVEVEVKMGRR